MKNQTLKTFSRHEQAQEVLLSKQYTGATGKVIGRASVSTLNNLAIIEKLLDKINPKHTLEIGMATGASAIVAGLYHKEKNPDQTPSHITIDPFQSSLWDSTGLGNVAKLGIASHVECHEAFSHVALPALLNSERLFDFIYVDGSHIFEDVFIDFFYCNRLLRNNGVILFDDSTDTHVRKALQFIRTNFKNHYEELNLNPIRQSAGSITFKSMIAWHLRLHQASAFKKTGTGIREWDTKLAKF